MSKSDTDIIQGFLRGKKDDYAIIVGWVKEVVNRVLWTDGVANEDVVSDTVYELLLGLRDGKFRYSSSLKTYIQTVTRNKSIDAIRSRKRARKYSYLACKETKDFDEIPDLFKDEDEFYLVDRIVSLTDPKCLNLWKMICIENLGYKEIARRTGLTEGAVKTRVSRCKEKALVIRSTLE